MDEDDLSGKTTANGQILSSGSQPYQRMNGRMPGYQPNQSMGGYPGEGMNNPMMNGPQMGGPQMGGGVPGWGNGGMNSPMPGAPMQPGMQPGMPGQSIASGAGNVPAPIPETGRGSSGLLKTVTIIILSLALVTFVGLFVWMFVRYNEASTDLEGKLEVARTEAANAQEEKDYEAYQEEAKNPYQSFTGPTDYGSLSFQYPKTWSLYVADDASDGRDYRAFFNPGQVDKIDEQTTIHALRVTIKDESYDDVVKSYQTYVERQEKGLSAKSVQIGVDGAITANLYTGTLPDTEDLTGHIIVFKIRDKAVIMQTDSLLFEGEFDKILSTVTFVQ